MLCFRVPLGLKPKSLRRLGFRIPFCPRLPAAMSPPFVASQPHCLGHLQHFPWLPHGSPELDLTLQYRACTALASSGETLAPQREKHHTATVVAVACTMIAVAFMIVVPWSPFGFALPQTPELTENNQARIKHGGFLRDTFQVIKPPKLRVN